MHQASDPRRGHVSIIDMRNSLNIHFTGIYALGNLFSVTFYEKRDQDEISIMNLKFSLLIKLHTEYISQSMYTCKMNI